MLDQGIVVMDCRQEASCEELFVSLEDVLQKEVGIYREMRDFIVSENHLLGKYPTAAKINDSNAAKENIILKARLLEEVRQNILKKIARQIDVSDDATHAGLLTDFAPALLAKKIEALGKQLAMLAGSIAEANDANRRMLEAQALQVNGSMNFLSALLDSSGMYAQNGKMGQVHGLGKILRTEG